MATVGGRIMIASEIGLFVVLGLLAKLMEMTGVYMKTKTLSSTVQQYHTFSPPSIHVSLSLCISLKETKGKKDSAVSLNRRNASQKASFISVASMLSILISVHQ